MPFCENALTLGMWKDGGKSSGLSGLLIFPRPSDTSCLVWELAFRSPKMTSNECGNTRGAKNPSNKDDSMLCR